MGWGAMHLTLVTPICSILSHGGISQNHAGIEEKFSSEQASLHRLSFPDEMA